MRKPILEFAARRFRVVGVQVFYDAENELGREVAVEFVSPVSPDDGDGSAFVDPRRRLCDRSLTLVSGSRLFDQHAGCRGQKIDAGNLLWLHNLFSTARQGGL